MKDGTQTKSAGIRVCCNIARGVLTEPEAGLCRGGGLVGIVTVGKVSVRVLSTQLKEGIILEMLSPSSFKPRASQLFLIDGNVLVLQPFINAILDDRSSI